MNSGVSWTLQTSAAQWGVRCFHSSVVVGSNIIIMGGESDSGGGKMTL